MSALPSILTDLRRKLTAPPSEVTLREPQPIEIRRQDLPLCCPRPHETLWNMHPRVYLPIEEDPHREATCPYCGARYRLVD